MRTILLSFFLIFIIGVGLMMTARKVRENFANPTTGTTGSTTGTIPGTVGTTGTIPGTVTGTAGSTGTVAGASAPTPVPSTDSALLPVSTTVTSTVAPPVAPPKTQINTIQRALDGTWRDENQQVWAPVNKSRSCSASSESSRDHCEDKPDMSQYIKKDEIPCWNCTL